VQIIAIDMAQGAPGADRGGLIELAGVEKRPGQHGVGALDIGFQGRGPGGASLLRGATWMDASIQAFLLWSGRNRMFSSWRRPERRAHRVKQARLLGRCSIVA
jgi:hypothetical protein